MGTITLNWESAVMTYVMSSFLRSSGLPNARLDCLQELLPYVELQAVGHEAFDDLLASDYDMVTSARNR